MTDIREALAAYDRFMSGGAISPEDEALAKRVSLAASFGAAAYERGIDADNGAHAMIRSALLALIDPAHGDLDYLRQASEANPTP